jgi:hypothetical protein
MPLFVIGKNMHSEFAEPSSKPYFLVDFFKISKKPLYTS